MTMPDYSPGACEAHDGEPTGGVEKGKPTTLCCLQS